MSGFTEEEVLVKQTLGFKPKQFLREVSSMVDATLESSVATYKKELLAIAASKGYANITEDVIDDSCQELLERMKSAYNKNMDKFELYALRNIFTLPSPEESSHVLASRQALNSATKEVDKLRQDYLKAQAKHNELQYECYESELLLKDMKSALFNLRVGSQVLDEFQVRPIADKADTLNQKKARLDGLIKRAATLVDEMDIENMAQGGDISQIFNPQNITKIFTSINNKLTNNENFSQEHLQSEAQDICGNMKDNPLFSQMMGGLFGSMQMPQAPQQPQPQQTNTRNINVDSSHDPNNTKKRLQKKLDKKIKIEKLDKK